MAQETLEQIRKIRLEKVAKLRELGIDPYPSKVNGDPKPISDSLNSMDQTFEVAGRIMGMRGHGNVTFMDLKDESGEIQLWFQKNNLGEKYKLLKLIDMGDFLYAKGKVSKTSAGEVSIDVAEFQMLSKSIRPLPSTWHGLKDVEERYRKRYLDMILNPDVKKRLDVRSKVISSIREYLDSNGFTEVETPTLQPIYGGGFARPFITHHNALDSDFYLRISDEMYLKRLIVGGYKRVYEITKVFRNEGTDYDHNPEFTMFEAQAAFKDYFFGMDLIEEIIEFASRKVLGTNIVKYQDKEINFERPWKRMTVVESIKEFTGIDPLEWKTIEEAKTEASKLDIKPEKLKEVSKMQKIGEVIAFVFEETVEEKLIQPTIIYEYPIEVSPLAKKCDDERFTQRFEMFVNGSELGNNYSELNDPIDLTKRFVEEKEREKAGFDEAHQTDYDYLTAIEHGFPPTCGVSIGIDRLVIFLSDAQNIKEVIAFPTLRPEKSLDSLKSDKHHKVKNFTISNDVKEKFPEISFAYTVISNVDIKKKNKNLEEEKQKLFDEKKSLTIEEVRTLKPIKSYREMLKKTGVDVGSRMPSPEALLKRLVNGKGIYTINTAVDSYNLAVVETAVGLGGFDFDKVSTPVELRFSKVGEEMRLLGDDDITKTKVGELVYSDDEKLLTLDLNYRDIDATKITEKTNNIILFADGGGDIKKEEVLAALKKGAENIVRYCGGNIGDYILVN